MKVKFLRKPTREELLPQDEFVIEKEVILDNKSFQEFSNLTLRDYDFIEENKELMYFDGLGIVHCILVKCNDFDYGFLVNSSGYSYGRYVAYIPLKLL